jgi:predicted acyltransferase
MTQTITTHKMRLLSLDFFRGLTVAAMILVNTPGDWGHIYPPLAHSKWDGCTPTDLVFPFFLFMVGVSIVYSAESKKNKFDEHSKIILGALRRMVILILLGLAIFFFYHPGFSNLRFPGVLQRIGVVYFITSIIYLKTNAKTQYWILGIILVSYYLMMVCIPTPDGYVADLTPEHNLGAWIDRAVFSTNHLNPYTKTWDAVGLFTTYPSIATALIGIRVGSLLKKADLDINEKVIKLFVTGIVLVCMGLVTDLFFPINKALWTSSYVLYSAGICTLGLTLSYWIIDVKGHQQSAWVFAVFGTNAISAYVLSEIAPGLIKLIKITQQGNTYNGVKYVYKNLFLTWLPPLNASLLYACFFVLLMWLIMYVLYSKKINIKI